MPMDINETTIESQIEMHSIGIVNCLLADIKKKKSQQHTVLPGNFINAPTCDQVRVFSLVLEIVFMNFIELFKILMDREILLSII